MSQADMMSQLAAELNGHSITDEDGNINSEPETEVEETAPQEQTTEDEPTPAEKPTETEEEAPKASDEDEETPVEDESGKRYVPEKRFKSVYKRAKEAERKVKDMETQLEAAKQIQATAPQAQTERKLEKADIIELKMALPQFNPHSDDYDEGLDQLGFTILRANPGMTPLQAGLLAIETANKLTGKVAQARTEARTVKTQQSDQGITTRVVSRKAQEPDFSKMNDKELETYMKQNGMWK